MFALGAAAMAAVAGGVLLLCEPLKSAAPERLTVANASSDPGKPPKCEKQVWREGVLRTPAQAELVFRASVPDHRFERTRVRITDQGESWLVEQIPPEPGPGTIIMGGVLIVRIAKCDGAITFVKGED